MYLLMDSGGLQILTYRVEDAAEVMRVSKSQMKIWVQTGVVPSFTIGAMRFIHRSDLEQFVERHRRFGPDFDFGGANHG